MAAVAVLAGATTLPATGSDATDIAFFESKIRPVLVEKCYACHSAEAETVQGGLLLDTREGIRRGGDTGPAVVPGDPAASMLLTAMHYRDGLEMPPDGRLPADVVADVEAWITRGAADPRDGATANTAATIDIEAGRAHWSFQPLSRSAVPRVQDESWPRTDIDRFILAGLEAQGIRPVPDAEPADLRRRMAFALAGLPPDEQALGRNDPSVYAADLLASPRFGERWARFWLDVARYADSTGGGHNVLFPLAFRYRNYVIDAFNADKPYDQFVREQLAGDLLPAADDATRNAQLAATGFLCVGVKDLREQKERRFRMSIADEQIDATSRTFLGLSIACAKCHDHKFDPIPTADYYALAGIFTSSEPMLGVRRNRQSSPLAAGVVPQAGAAAVFGDDDLFRMLKADVEAVYAGLAVRNEKWRILGEKGLSKNDRSHEAMLDAMPSVQALQRAAEEKKAAYELLRTRYDAALPHALMAMRESEPRDCAIHIRGEDAHLGPVMSRGFPRVLTTAATPTVPPDQSGRLQLADWIADPRHPLTARVMVNRIWQHLFGAGLVETPDDFGFTGQPPSNPALLDHLARRFIAHGWSVKAMIAEIMDSRVYRLGTAHNERAHEIDPANRLHWRMNRRRLDSDALFDSVRHVSGDLVLERPAPVIPPTPDDDRIKSMDRSAFSAPTTRHRTIYQPVLREYVPEDWKLWDFPDPELVTGRRSITTVPTQALHLMNSPFIAMHAGKVAELLMRSASDHESFVQAAYLRILSRAPTSDEARAASEFLGTFPGADSKPLAAASALCQALFGSPEFLYVH